MTRKRSKRPLPDRWASALPARNAPAASPKIASGSGISIVSCTPSGAPKRMRGGRRERRVEPPRGGVGREIPVGRAGRRVPPLDRGVGCARLRRERREESPEAAFVGLRHRVGDARDRADARPGQMTARPGCLEQADHLLPVGQEHRRASPAPQVRRRVELDLDRLRGALHHSAGEHGFGRRRSRSDPRDQHARARLRELRAQARAGARPAAAPRGRRSRSRRGARRRARGTPVPGGRSSAGRSPTGPFPAAPGTRSRPPPRAGSDRRSARRRRPRPPPSPRRAGRRRSPPPRSRAARCARRARPPPARARRRAGPGRRRRGCGPPRERAGPERIARRPHLPCTCGRAACPAHPDRRKFDPGADGGRP